MIVGAKPTPLIAEISASDGLHLLPIEFGAGLDEAYLPTGFDRDDYPNLIEMETEIPSVATGLVLLAAASKGSRRSHRAPGGIRRYAFSRFGELKKDGRHPKWREINLAASLPGWTRNPAAEAWLTEQRKGSARRDPLAKIEAGVAHVHASGTRPEEALFKQYIEWQRARGH